MAVVNTQIISKSLKMKELRSATNNTAIVINDDGTLVYSDNTYNSKLYNKLGEYNGDVVDYSNVSINSSSFAFYPYYYGNTFGITANLNVTANSTTFDFGNYNIYNWPPITYDYNGFNTYIEGGYNLISANSSSLRLYLDYSNNNFNYWKLETELKANSIVNTMRANNTSFGSATDPVYCKVLPNSMSISYANTIKVSVNTEAIYVSSNGIYNAPNWALHGAYNKNAPFSGPVVYFNDKTIYNEPVGQSYNTLFNNLKMQWGTTPANAISSNSYTLGFLFSNNYTGSSGAFWTPYTFERILFYQAHVFNSNSVVSSSNSWAVAVESCNTSCIKFNLNNAGNTAVATPASSLSINWLVIGIAND